MLSVSPTELSTTLPSLPDSDFIAQLLSCSPPIDLDEDVSYSSSEIVIDVLYLLSKIYFKALVDN